METDHDYAPNGLRWVMISALQHYSYCPRQCAFIHVEHTFDENLYTLRGQRGHERAHSSERSFRVNVVQERSVRLWCDRLGLVGISDVLEVERDAEGKYTRIVPVEYKTGKRHASVHDDVQLCAQALCLESMFAPLRVLDGAVYHIQSKKRRRVEFTPSLRERTHKVLLDVRAMLENSTLPPPCSDSRCHKCSLLWSCMPFAIKSIERNEHPPKTSLTTVQDV